jgi:death-on-curing protein
VARPKSGFGGVDFYATPFARAAALMESVIQRHSFVDGNKRTGLLAALFSLEEEGYEVEASHKQLADVAVEVADHHLDVDGLARWLEVYAAQSGPS